MAELLVEETPQEKVKNRVLLDRKEILRSDKGYWTIRWAQDIFFSLIALLFFWPFMLITAIVILIDRPGASPI